MREKILSSLLQLVANCTLSLEQYHLEWVGINCPDITKVIRYGAPNDLECYMQETGRADPDEKTIATAMLYSLTNVSRHISTTIVHVKEN